MHRCLRIDQATMGAFCARHGIRRLALFGSQLTGAAGPDSDVALRVEFQPGAAPTFFDFVGMEEDLSGLIGGGRRVDLRTPGELSRYFRDDVMTSSGWPRCSLLADDLVRMRYMRDTAASAIRFAGGRQRVDLDRDEMLLFALVRPVEIIGEATARVSAEGRNHAPGIPWNIIVGMRHRLVHTYFDIDQDILWATVQRRCHHHCSDSWTRSYPHRLRPNEPVRASSSRPLQGGRIPAP